MYKNHSKIEFKIFDSNIFTNFSCRYDALKMYNSTKNIHNVDFVCLHTNINNLD